MIMIVADFKGLRTFFQKIKKKKKKDLNGCEVLKKKSEY